MPPPRASLTKYEPDKWNRNPVIKATHNCYSYFLNKQDPNIIDRCNTILDYQRNVQGVANPDPTEFCKRLKPQPGYYSGYPEVVDKSEYNCDDLNRKILADNPEILPATKTSACPDGYRKAAVTVDPGKVYHFYREDTPGSWSHKPENTEVVNVDADGHLIVGPDSANRNYGYLERLGRRHNLSELCRYYCLPTSDTLNMVERLVPLRKNYELVIIGAGLNGLYLATKLQPYFTKIVIIEQSNRIGGRIFTEKPRINGKQYTIEAGANRFSKYHTRLMRLIKELKLESELVLDTDDSEKIYISSKKFNYHNNVNLQDLFQKVLDYASDFNKQQLTQFSFTELVKQSLSVTEAKLLHQLWSEYMKLSRVRYNGGSDAKLRLHPTYPDTYCDLKPDNTETSNRYTPYFKNYVYLFQQSAFLGIRMVYTLLFNKRRNQYYRLKSGNIELCEKLLYQFRLHGGEIIYNTKFTDYTYNNNKFKLKFVGRLTKLSSNQLILAIPTENVITIPKLTCLHPYLSKSRGS